MGIANVGGMPAPARWNTPGLTWATPGLTWGGTVPAKTKRTMNHLKAKTDFSGYAAADLGAVAQHIHDEIAAHAAVFVTPPVTMATLAGMIADFTAKLSARETRATVDVLAFNLCREVVEGALNRLGNYVNEVAQGDAMIVEQSGFPSYSTHRAADPNPPSAPQNLRIRHGDVSGTLVVRYQTDRQPSTNEVQVTTGNPNLEADWKQFGIFRGQKAELTGLTPATKIWVRVRTVERAG